MSAPSHRFIVSFAAFAVVMAAGFVSQVATADDFGTWSQQPAADLLPTISNAVTVVRMEQLLNTPWAKAEGESANRQRLYERGEAVIPPWVASATISALLRPSQHGTAFRAIVAELQDDAPVQAKSEQSSELFDGAVVLDTSRDAVFVGRAGERVVGWSPASETELKHWFDGAFANGMTDSLRALVENGDYEVILGLDLDGLADTNKTRQRISSDSRFDDDVERAIELVLDARTVSCSINATEKLDCTVQIQSAGGTKYSADDAELVKSLFLAIAGDTGFSLPEFHDFIASVDGDSVVLTGTLHDDSLAALTSLGVPPIPSGESLFEAKPKTQSTRRTKRTSPLDDFNRAVNMIEALDRRQRRAKDPSSVASWCDRTAGDIDEISTSTNDSTVQSFTARTATRLRFIAASLRGLTADLNAEQASVTYNVKRDPGWASVNIWGGVGYREPSVQVDTNLRDVRERQAKLARESSADREATWNDIQEDIAATKRTLLGVAGN